ncbi:MAG: glutamate--tRNA ligase [Candidatus Omnitrophica bacterium]|nr:glutamate--tRNA ligase [Candidatus Omnitrophota bacterium]
MEPSEVKVRFAPSPTGHLHIGGVRTALFNFLYARSVGGKFFLRMEDTDRERSREEFAKEILESMAWLGLSSDGEVFYQSKRLARYQEAAEDLIKHGLAYEEKVDSKRAIKFKMPAARAVFHDLVHGEIQFDASLFGDLVILKSDGYPTYQLACVVDDHEMEITHVIRGDDHLSNTPRQLLLFEAFGWKPPKYGHLPLILGADGAPLSKRHGAVSLENYRAEGFLAEGLLNYLALLGWGPPDNQEFFSLQDLIKKFSLKKINKASTQFDSLKLEWLNAQHIKKLPEAEYLAKITDFHKDLAKKFSPEKWKIIALLYRSRIKTFKDLTEEAAYCFSDIENYSEPMYDDFLNNRSLRAHLNAWLDRAGEFTGFDRPDEVEKMTRDAAQGWGIEARDLIHPLRFALTGKTVSPGLFELMSALGKETCVKRVRKFLKKT